MQKYHLENLDCTTCAAKIEKAVQETQGVRFASVDFATTTLFLDADDLPRVHRTIQQVEPEITLAKKSGKVTLEPWYKQSDQWLPILAAGLLFGLGIIFNSSLFSTPYRIGYFLVFGMAYIIGGKGVLKKAFRNIVKGQVFDENFLMSVATLGAIAIGELPEAAGVMLFYMVGEYTQSMSVNRSRKSIQALLEIQPDSAWVVVDGIRKEVEPESVEVGDTILVLPGERIPLDGEITHGFSQVDTSPLTGESVPVSVGPGAQVLAGAINQEGMLTVQVNRPFSESSISRILEMVENASSRKAQTENFITRFARIYSPIIVLSALGVAVLPPLLIGASFSEWIYRAMVVLVISCPCALVISIPLGYFGGVGGASRRGILVKGSNFLDILAKTKTVVFDKTGTLTRGVFKVTRILPRNGFEQEDLLRYAAQAESGSNHPIARSIRMAYGQETALPIDSTLEIAGHGVQTLVEGRVILAGNDPLLHREKVDHDLDLCDVPGTVVHVAVDGRYAGCLVISDELKPEAVTAIQALRDVGVDQIIMLTGDKWETSFEIANKLGIDDYKAELLPEDKVTAIEEILAEKNKRRQVAFVGDGINDAPALARADVGIAMGGLGSEAAIETADVVIMADSPSKVAEAIQISKKTRRIVWQNITLAIIIKLVFISLGISGEASMWQAVFGDMGVALLAVFNATRILR